MGYATGPAQPGKPVPDPVSRDPAQLRNPTTPPAPARFPHRETATAPRGFVLGRFSNAGNQRRAHRMPPLPPASENFTKERAQDYGIFPRSAPIRDRLGNVDLRVLSRPSARDHRGLLRRNTRVCRSSELGHEPSFSMPLNRVRYAAVHRHSRSKVGNAAVGRPSYGSR